MDYWKECVEGALDEAGIKATDEQIEIIVGWVEGAHENYGMAFGHDCIPNPLLLENQQLKREIEKERNKVTCDVCKGEGWITTPGPYHSGTSQCWKCRGEQRISV